MLRWLGVALVVGASGVGAAGYAAGVRRGLRQLAALVAALDRLRSEIETRLTPMPEVFELLAEGEEKTVCAFFRECARIMHEERTAGVARVFRLAMARTEGLRWSARTRETLGQLALCLGRFDLAGQGRAIELAGQRLRAELAEGQASSQARCRSYETVGVCAGLAVAVILL